MLHIEGGEFLRRLRSPLEVGSLSGLVLIDLRSPAPAPAAGDLASLESLPIVIAAHGLGGEAWLNAVDVVVDAQDIAALEQRAGANPIASAALALLLRGSENRSCGAGLVAESAVYSTLQAGPEFRRWRDAHPVRARAAGNQPAVEVTRKGDRLGITLCRPEVRNAFSARMREEMLEALSVATIDSELVVELRGEGPAFCAGGDLDEFGTRPDPATAHITRLDRSVGRAIASMSDRVTAYLHGACYGSGIELPAFAGTVIAAPDTRIALPELRLGLVPGAGGTVSLVRRAGRHRVAWLTLLGRTIDARTALSWGLVDGIV